MSAATEIAGQMNPEERRILREAVLAGPQNPRVLLEVGTWLGGGSTLSFLQALEEQGEGHLWGIEADRSIYERMLANLSSSAPEAMHRFTPLFGLSHDVIPRWLETPGSPQSIDLVFLDGGDNPLEQVMEFQLLDPHIPVGGQLFAHDAKLRKGKWLVPYLSLLDHWESTLHDVSEEGLFFARKIKLEPSAAGRRAAEAALRRHRRSPLELIGTLLPGRINRFILRFLPTKMVQQITQGRTAKS